VVVIGALAPVSSKDLPKLVFLTNQILCNGWHFLVSLLTAHREPSKTDRLDGMGIPPKRPDPATGVSGDCFLPSENLRSRLDAMD
jgi:hypothetical protein